MHLRSPAEGRIRMRSCMRGECGACARPRKLRPGGSGHHVRRHYDRCAGCFRWTGTGRRGRRPQTSAGNTRRKTPATSQETWPGVETPRPENLGQSRGGAPRGERARKRAVRASGSFVARLRARGVGRWQHRPAWRGVIAVCAFRRSASPRFMWRRPFIAFVSWLSFLAFVVRSLLARAPRCEDDP